MKKYLVPLAVAAALVIPTSAHADGGTVEVSADCVGVTVTTAGWATEATGQVGIASAPPEMMVLNSSKSWTWQTPGSHTYSVLIHDGFGTDTYRSETVDCGGFPEVISASPPIEPEPVIVESEPVALPEPPAFDPHPIWPGLELAPPW